MAGFKDMVSEEEDAPIVSKRIDTIRKNENKTNKNIEKKKKKKAEIDSIIESMLQNKKEKKTERLGLSIDSEVYDKLKTLSVASGNSVTKVVSELLQKALVNVEINEKYVKQFDNNFIKKRKNN